MIEDDWTLDRRLRRHARTPQLAVMGAIRARWGDLYRNGRRPVLVVDEAQLAGPMLLEEIRLGDVADDQQ